jgi:ubiquinone biosynthesis monooxygenase Coq7
LIRALLSHLSGPSARAEDPHADSASQLPAVLLADLRTDHAGETGAVMIYRGILAATHDAAVRHFALAHLATETKHLAGIEPLLPLCHRSRLLPIWRMAGWLTGALPALVGPRAVFATIEAVETFVDHHYTEQIESIDRVDPGQTQSALQTVRALLVSCRADEIEHRDEASSLLAQGARPNSLALRTWTWAVGTGSRLAVGICRHI